MRRRSYKKYFLLGAVLFLLASLPLAFVEHLRGKIVGILSPAWKLASKKPSTELNRLEGENHLLRIEIGKLRALLEQETKLKAEVFEKSDYLANLSGQIVPARVIYRDPESWSSSIWVSVGEKTNLSMNRQIIQKNSPVIVGKSIVGVVDYVGKKQSRIRLITDMGLKPSVRAVRGTPQNALLVEHIDPLISHLLNRKDLPLSMEDRTLMIHTLEELKEKIEEDVDIWYLAKGILQGAGTPLWRSRNHTLRGIGFNYDFADEKGPAREFESGKPVGSELPLPAIPILKVSDLLLTTGLDGVFPPGFRVAEVTKIYPLREGAYTYEIEAAPSVGNLDTLQTVFILPPHAFPLEDPSQQ